MWQRVSAGILIAAAGVFVGGCAETSYVYRPAQPATAMMSGLPAAQYAIPRERPTGQVFVLSSGVTEITVTGGPIPVLFVRLVVSNNSDEAAWSLDTRQQALLIAGQRVTPAYINPYKQPLPIMQIPRGERRTVDLYYPLPAGAENNDEVPAFDVEWSVQTGDRQVAERTPFDRLSVDPAYGGAYYAYYGRPVWGPYGWYDPFWPYHRFGYGVYVGHGGYWGRGVYYGHPHASPGRSFYFRAAPHRR
jgi:hypothetical protein